MPILPVLTFLQPTIFPPSDPTWVDVATAIITAITILIALALALIAFYLHRDFRQHLRDIERQNLIIESLHEKLDEVSFEIDRNKNRDQLIASIMHVVVGDIINAEKIQTFLRSKRHTAAQKEKIETEIRGNYDSISRRMIEISYLLDKRHDKRAQILSQICSEEKIDLSTLNFLKSVSMIEEHEGDKTAVVEAIGVVKKNLSGEQ